MEQNFVSAEMTDAQRDEILALLDTAGKKLEPFLHHLSPDERGTINRISAADLHILEQAHTFAVQNPGSLPDDIDVEELGADIALARQEQPIVAKLLQLEEMIDDASMSVLSDAYNTSLDVYRVAKAINHSGKYDAFVKAFGARFVKRRRPRKGESNPPKTEGN